MTRSSWSASIRTSRRNSSTWWAACGIRKQASTRCATRRCSPVRRRASARSLRSWAEAAVAPSCHNLFHMTKATGHVWLVGAGPGDPGLITLAGAAALAAADVVLVDALVSEALLGHAQAEAEVVAVG